jgi:histone H3/H4
MTFDEMPVGHSRQHCACGNCEWCWEMLVHSVYEEPLDREVKRAESAEEKRTNGAPGSFYCRHGALERFDDCRDWIASYVRTRLLTMSTDPFRISRHTVEVAAQAVRDRFFSDMDAILRRVLDRATMRQLQDGSSTIMAEDVRIAMHYVEPSDEA